MKHLNKILWGIVFIALGIILGLNAFEVTNINIFFKGWWCLFIIIPCAIDLFSDHDKTGNIIGLIIGILLLLACQNKIDFELIFKLLIPIILIIIGLSFIFKDVINSNIKKKIKEINKNNSNSTNHCATFGGCNVNYSNEQFNGCEINAIFGGVKCDLTDAIIDKDVVINACSIFGGIDIIAPKNVNIKISSTPIFGGVDNKFKNSNDEQLKTIYLNCTCIFGGVEIK